MQKKLILAQLFLIFIDVAHTQTTGTASILKSSLKENTSKLDLQQPKHSPKEQVISRYKKYFHNFFKEKAKSLEEDLLQNVTFAYQELSSIDKQAIDIKHQPDFMFIENEISDLKNNLVQNHKNSLADYMHNLDQHVAKIKTIRKLCAALSAQGIALDKVIKPLKELKIKKIKDPELLTNPGFQETPHVLSYKDFMKIKNKTDKTILKYYQKELFKIIQKIQKDAQNTMLISTLQATIDHQNYKEFAKNLKKHNCEKPDDASPGLIEIQETLGALKNIIHPGKDLSTPMPSKDPIEVDDYLTQAKAEKFRHLSQKILEHMEAAGRYRNSIAMLIGVKNWESIRSMPEQKISKKFRSIGLKEQEINQIIDDLRQSRP